MINPRDIALELLLEPTERDKQVSIGASNASNPCTRCLADDLLGVPREPSAYMMGAIIGTAVHMLLEDRVTRMHPEWMPEGKLVIGHLEGYGEVKSTTDLYIPKHLQVNDWKTTTKAKLPAIKEALTTEPTPYDLSKVVETRFKVKGYKAQLHLYGLGLLRAGLPVETVGLGFVCRDASTEKDVWGWTMPYSPEYAESVWGRLERLWSALRDGRDPATLPSDPACYYCNVVRTD